MRQIGFVILLLLAGTTIGFAQTSTGVECVRAQCEGKGRNCVETLYATYNTCLKAARAKCDKVSPAEKFNCLRSEISPCAQTRNKEQENCLSNVTACYRTCAPFPGKRNDYWCVADFDDRVTAAFCPLPLGATSLGDQCNSAFKLPPSAAASMTCDPLN